MKAFLMYRDRDFDLEAPLPPNSEALIQDLELNVLFDAMALGDKYLHEVASKAVLQILGGMRTRCDIVKISFGTFSPIRLLARYPIRFDDRGE